MSAALPGQGPRRAARLRPAWLLTLAFLAWRNLWRNPVRSALTAAAMVFGVTSTIMFIALIEGMKRDMAHQVTDLTLGHLQVHREAFRRNQDLYAVIPDAAAERLRAGTPYRYAPRVYAGALASAGQASTGVRLMGVDPALERRVTSFHRHVRRGRFGLDEPPPAEGPAAGHYPVLVGFQLAKNLRIDVGSELVLITQAADGSIGNGLFRVAGVLKAVDPIMDRMGVVLSMEGWQSLMFLSGGVHELAVKTGDVTLLEEPQRRIAEVLATFPGGEAEGGPLQVRRWDQINPGLSDALALTDISLTIVAVIVLGIAALVLLNTILMSVFERITEFGILMALGMGRGWLMAMVMVEAFFLSLLASAVGAGLGALWAWRLETVGWDISAYMPEGIDWAGVSLEPIYRAYLTGDQVVKGVVFMLVISMISALLPSWTTTRLKPTEAFKR